VDLSGGSHYVVCANSAPADYWWTARIYVDETLVAEGRVSRGEQLRADFEVVPPEPPPEPPPEKGIEWWKVLAVLLGTFTLGVVIAKAPERRITPTDKIRRKYGL
jgi:hypothetical protein